MQAKVVLTKIPDVKSFVCSPALAVAGIAFSKDKLEPICNRYCIEALIGLAFDLLGGAVIGPLLTGIRGNALRKLKKPRIIRGACSKIFVDAHAAQALQNACPFGQGNVIASCHLVSSNQRCSFQVGAVQVECGSRPCLIRHEAHVCGVASIACVD